MFAPIVILLTCSSVEQREKDAKVQRQVEKGKKKAIDETPGKTRQFLEGLQGDNALGNTSVPHIQVRFIFSSHFVFVFDYDFFQIQSPITPLSKKAKQKASEKRTAQLVLQRYLATNATRSQTSTPSESTVESQSNASQDKLHPSRSRSRSHSRAGSQQPSTRASSAQPSCAGSPTSSVVSHNDMGTLPSMDLSEYLDILPVHLAPRITIPPLLAPPLRDPERVSTPEEMDISTMSAKERAAYRKLLKLPLKGIKDGDRAVVTGALSRFESLVLTHDPFPSEENFRKLAGHANFWSCNKSTRANLQMMAKSPYEDLVIIFHQTIVP